jgi:outer membrane protein
MTNFHLILNSKHHKMIHLRKYIIALLFVPAMLVQAQSAGDSLTLSGILNEVIHNYPAIKKTQSDLAASDAKINLAKTAYLPDVNLSANYAFIGPTSTLDLSAMGIGKVSLYPANNYSAAINVSENIYDFGKTKKNIAFEKQSKEMVELNVEQLKQKLSGMIVGNFYSIVFLQEAIKIKDEELVTLQSHFHFVEKKVASGSATKYEELTTKVRISTNETQKADLVNALKIQISQLNSFLGKSHESKLNIKNELLESNVLATNDSLFNFAFDHRNEMRLTRQKSALAMSRLQIVGTANNPSLNFMGSGGIKNGYIPDLMAATPNFTLGIGLKIPLFDANRSKYTKIQAQTDIDGNVQETEIVRRNIVNEVIESKTNAESAQNKVKLAELQLQQAQEAYQLAETSFKAGTITNLELMYSFTAVTDSKLALLKTKIDHTVSLQRLKIALGERLY